MDKIEISKALSKKLDKEVVISDIELIGSGYHSDGYKLTTNQGENYFLKRIKSEDLGFEYPERKVSAMLVSHGMKKKNETQPHTLGVAIKNKEIEFLPEIDHQTEVYHFQEYAEGENYFKMLQERNNKKQIDEIDKNEIDKVIEFISKVHAIKYPSTDNNKLKAIYNDSLRSVIGHPENLLLFLQKIEDESPTIPPNKQADFMVLMLEAMHYYKNRPDRLTALHGDFWAGNAFFKKDGSFFMIDYSRIPWGDPGFDVGYWVSLYLMQYYITHNIYFKQLSDYFLEKYIEKTGNKEVLKTMPYGMGLIAAIYSSPKGIPGINNDVRISFFNHVCDMLKKKEFFWD